MSVDKRPNGSYRVRWREVPGGPQLSRAFRYRRDADRFDREVAHALQSGAYVNPAAATVPMVELIVEHVARQPWRSNTLHNATWSIEHVRAYFGDRAIGEIRTSDLQAFVSQLDLAPRSVAVVWRFVRQTYRAAQLDGVIARDPCFGVKLPRHHGAELVVPTADEVAALVDGAPAEFAAAVVIAADLGLRAGEIAGLTVDRVDFLRREVRVDRQWHGKLDEFAPVKSPAAVRTVPAGGRVLGVLAAQIERHGTGDHGVIVHAGGRPLNANRVGWRWEQTATAVERPLKLHDLRHFYASSLLAAGVSIVAVQRALGHSSAKVTLDTYGHLVESDTDRIRVAIDGSRRAEDSVRTAERPQRPRAGTMPRNQIFKAKFGLADR